MTTRNRAITVLLAGLLLALLLACGAAPLTQEEAQRQCRQDPQCHPAPSWVVREREGK
jgi:CHASE1-domain containing sensor protein